MKFYIFAGFIAAITVFSSGCTATGVGYYNDDFGGKIAASRVDLSKFKERCEDRTPVILIHGLWGAELREKENGQKRVWGDFSTFAPAAVKKYSAMALYPRQKQGSDPLFAADILRTTRVDFLGMSFEFENYSRLIDLLQAIGYVPEKAKLPENSHYCTLFIYHYDWRKSIDENASGLADFVEEKKKYLENQFKTCPQHRNKEVRFDLLGHSMGGLIARYYAEYGRQPLGSGNKPLPKRNWYGAKNIRKLIMAGTPNAGYVDSFVELVNGVRFNSLAAECPAGVLATFPSYYQMLPDISTKTVKFVPSGKAVDIFDIRMWKKYQWGLLAENDFNHSLLAKMYPELSDTGRSAAAAEYVNKLLNKASRLKLLLARPIGLPPEPLKYYLFASCGVETNEQVAVDPDCGKLHVSSAAPGDGKVTLRSAGFDRKQKNNPLMNSGIYVLDGGHMGFMDSSLFAANLALVLYSEL